jgi:hypothetical protein
MGEKGVIIKDLFVLWVECWVGVCGWGVYGRELRGRDVICCGRGGLARSVLLQE